MTTAPGPLGEEAARLVDALSEWARGQAGDPQIATDTAECRLCPLCQLIAVMRHARPETFGHLLEASAALTAALRSVVEAHAHGATAHGGVQRIDLDDDAGSNDGARSNDGAGSDDGARAEEQGGQH
jgi:hypothetical protein